MSRKRICLLGGPLDSFYSRQFWIGAAGEAESLGLDLVYLAGGFQRNYFDGISEKCGLNESRSTLAYQLLDPSLFDGILVWGAQFQHDIDDTTIASIIARFSPLPVVSVGWSGPGCYSILFDNYSGMREIISHLIKDHGHKKIAFIKSGHSFLQREAEERFRAYGDEMKANGIQVDPRLVVYGGEIEEKRRKSLEEHSFGEHWAELAMQELLDIRGVVPGRDFTAVVARDDDAALRCISYLRGRKVDIPRDVAVCGFDDIVAGRCWDPPLTTVAQSFKDQAAQGMRLLHSILQGEQASAVTFVESSKAVIRESCGCLNQFMRRTFSELSGNDDSGRSEPAAAKNIETSFKNIAEGKATLSDLSDEIRAGMQRLSEAGEDPMEMAEWLAAISRNSNAADNSAIIQSAQVLVGDIAQRFQLLRFINAQERQEQMDIINRDTFRTYDLNLVFEYVDAELPVIGAKGCAIVLFTDPMDPLEKSRVIFASSRGKRNRNASLDAPEFSTRHILPDGLWPDSDDPLSLYVELLFFAEHRLGYLVMEQGDSDGASYTSLASRLASVLEGAFLVQRLNEKRVELEKAYANILDLSERDSLTGLYNRRAFDREFQKEKRRMERYFEPEHTVCSLLFIDIDNFKHINDQFGHSVGDAVLRAVAESIAAIVRTTDIASRFGGDEFNVLLPSTGIDGAENLAGRIISTLTNNPVLIRRISELSGKGFAAEDGKTISCSIGISNSAFAGNNPEILIAAADRALYEAKQAGKGCYRIAKRIEPE